MCFYSRLWIAELLMTMSLVLPPGAAKYSLSLMISDAPEIDVIRLYRLKVDPPFTFCGSSCNSPVFNFPSVHNDKTSYTLPFLREKSSTVKFFLDFVYSRKLCCDRGHLGHLQLMGIQLQIKGLVEALNKAQSQPTSNQQQKVTHILNQTDKLRDVK